MRQAAAAAGAGGGRLYFVSLCIPCVWVCVPSIVYLLTFDTKCLDTRDTQRVYALCMRVYTSECIHIRVYTHPCGPAHGPTCMVPPPPSCPLKGALAPVTNQTQKVEVVKTTMATHPVALPLRCVPCAPH